MLTFGIVDYLVPVLVFLPFILAMSWVLHQSRTLSKTHEKTPGVSPRGLVVFAILIGAYGQVPGQTVNLVLTVVALGYVISYHRANGNVQVPEISTVICNKFRRVRQDSLLMVGS